MEDHQYSSEVQLRFAMRVVGSPMLIMVFIMAIDRFVMNGALGFVWWPSHYEEHGNTTMEFESMILVIYFCLGLSLWQASMDRNLDSAVSLNRFTIQSCIAHAIVMGIAAAWDFEREFWHFMPWGDVSGLIILGTMLWYFQRRYVLKQM